MLSQNHHSCSIPALNIRPTPAPPSQEIATCNSTCHCPYDHTPRDTSYYYYSMTDTPMEKYIICPLFYLISPLPLSKKKGARINPPLRAGGG